MVGRSVGSAAPRAMRACQAAAGAVGEEDTEEATPIVQLAALTLEDRVETRRRPRKRGGQRTLFARSDGCARCVYRPTPWWCLRPRCV